MLPYGFAAMMGLSQTLPAYCCRLWLKESIFYSHNQMLPVVLPAETDWRAWVGYSQKRLNTAPFLSVSWKFSLQWDNGADCLVTTSYQTPLPKIKIRFTGHPIQTSSWGCLEPQEQQERPRFITTHQREERQGQLHSPHLSFDLFLILSPDAWRVIQQRADQGRWLLGIRAQVWR